MINKISSGFNLFHQNNFLSSTFICPDKLKISNVTQIVDIGVTVQLIWESVLICCGFIQI